MAPSSTASGELVECQVYDLRELEQDVVRQRCLSLWPEEGAIHLDLSVGNKRQRQFGFAESRGETRGEAKQRHGSNTTNKVT